MQRKINNLVQQSNIFRLFKNLYLEKNRENNLARPSLEFADKKRSILSDSVHTYSIFAGRGQIQSIGQQTPSLKIGAHPSINLGLDPSPQSLYVERGSINYVILWKEDVAQLIGRLFSPSQKVKKLSHPFRLCFELGLGVHVHHAKY